MRIELSKNNKEIAVIVHLYYIDIWDEIVCLFKNITVPFDIYVTVNEQVSLKTIKYIQDSVPNIEVIQVENRGRDILPFLDVLHRIETMKYKYICKLHTKKSLHRLDGNLWRKVSLYDLLGSNKIVNEILKNFKEKATLGIVSPKNNILSVNDNIGSNKEKIKFLVSSCNLIYEEDCSFVAGSMMWLNNDILDPLYKLCKTDILNFEKEEGQLDGTMAHAVERFLGVLAESNGYSIEESPAKMRELDEEVLRDQNNILFKSDSLIKQQRHELENINVKYQDTIVSMLKQQEETLDKYKDTIEHMNKHQQQQEEMLVKYKNTIEHMGEHQKQQEKVLEEYRNTIEHMGEHQKQQKKVLEECRNTIEHMGEHQKQQENRIESLSNKLQKIYKKRAWKVISMLYKDLD